VLLEAWGGKDVDFFWRSCRDKIIYYLLLHAWRDQEWIWGEKFSTRRKHEDHVLIWFGLSSVTWEGRFLSIPNNKEAKFQSFFSSIHFFVCLPLTTGQWIFLPLSRLIWPMLKEFHYIASSDDPYRQVWLQYVLDSSYISRISKLSGFPPSIYMDKKIQRVVHKVRSILQVFF
jgi:hypothetical protein